MQTIVSIKIDGASHSIELIAEPVGDVAVDLDGNFSAASLSLEDAGQGDELVGYSRLSYARLPIPGYRA